MVGGTDAAQLRNRLRFRVNDLGFYQDLVPSGEQATYPGSTVHDPLLYEE